MNAAQLQQLIDAVGAAAGNRPASRKVPEFSSADPNEWQTWEENFLLIVAINGWDNRRARRELAAAMTGIAKTYVRDIDVGDVAAAAPIADQLTLYRARFMPEAAGDMARVTIRDACRTEGETVQGWHARLRALWVRAYPDLDANGLNNNKDLIEKFALGLADDYVTSEVWKARPATYADALTVANNMDAARMVLESRRPGSTAHLGLTIKKEPGINSLGNPSDQNSVNRLGSSNNRKDGKGGEVCNFCLIPGHYMRDCRSVLYYQRQYLKERSRRGRGSHSGRGSGGSRGGSSGRRGAGSGSHNRSRGSSSPGTLRRINNIFVHAAEALAKAQTGSDNSSNQDQGNC